MTSLLASGATMPGRWGSGVGSGSLAFPAGFGVPAGMLALATSVACVGWMVKLTVRMTLLGP